MGGLIQHLMLDNMLILCYYSDLLCVTLNFRGPKDKYFNSGLLKWEL
jgi:hypothetical protein